LRKNLVDRYITVDWSASNVPVTGKDSIWIGDIARRGTTLVLLESQNPRTRSEAIEIIADRLAEARQAGQKVMLGFDFVFGYPRGAAKAIAGAPDWQALWQFLARKVEDAPTNASNRFALAAEINRAFGVHGPHYWGHPQTHAYDGLAAKRPTNAYGHIPERRRAEALIKSAQPVWKLTGIGSVGSQSLLGIARLEALRTDPRFAGEIAVWPFQTDFERDLSKPITIVEIYPSLFPISAADGTPRDKAQVEISARRFAELDDAGLLAEFLSAPPSLSALEHDFILKEEGWIAGVGHAALLAKLAPARPAYLRDPDAIYAQSFATIRAEADLAHLPPELHDAAIRMIHACGMVDLAADIAGDPAMVSATQTALRAGAPILCDCEMVRSGIIERLLPGANARVVTLNEPAVPALAKSLGTTRSAAAIELWRDRLEGAVVVIGNAPTALFHLLELLDMGGPKPAAIIAAPVGFVGAAESKALLAENRSGVPFLTVLGRRGGSAIASAAFNAIAKAMTP
jgi:precorrin-8X/cobalt-precorrin-8 methylmutase